jgi:phage tail sheath protein FI
MPTYSTPGVYYERADASAPALGIVRMDIPGFVGIATRGPVDVPVPVESFRQFQAHFGDFTGAAFLAYAVRGFFENGGRRCWVVRVASDDPSGGYSASAVECAGAAGPLWRVAAASPGVWGNGLTVEWKATHNAQTSADPGQSTADYSVVDNVSGFERGTLARLRQAGIEILRVVNSVDVPKRRLIWRNPDLSKRLVYDEALIGLDPTLPLSIESIEYTLVVRNRASLAAVYSGLTLIPEHSNYGPAQLAPIRIPGELTGQLQLPPPPEPITIEELRPEYRELSLWRPLDQLTVPPAPLKLTGGRDGLAPLTTYDFIGEPSDPLDSDTVRSLRMRGFRRFDLIDEITTIAIPDLHVQPFAVAPLDPLPPCIPDPCLPIDYTVPAAVLPPEIGDLPPVFSDAQIFEAQAALVDYCETRGDRIALLSPPISCSRNDGLGMGAMTAWRNRFDSKYAALYYPWLRVVDPLRRPASLTRDLPPCGFVAGQFARTDFETGVHRAPANEPLNWVQDVTVPIDEERHGILNSLGINLIRGFSSRGIRVFGARTLSSDPDWVFLNVRRLLIMIRKALNLGLQWAVFEPNNELTRAKARLAIQSFLVAIYQRGALMGANINQAFFVKCDETNNPPNERANGRLLAEVGVAPSKPFEFVVLRVGRTQDEFEAEEIEMRRN